MTQSPSDAITALQQQLALVQSTESLRRDEGIATMCADLQNRIQRKIDPRPARRGKKRPAYMTLEQQQSPSELQKRLSGCSADFVAGIAGSNKRLIENAIKLSEMERFDRLTPFFLEQLRRLSPQMGMVLHVFAKHPHALHVRDVVALTAIAATKASTILRRLADYGYLRLHRGEKKNQNTYEIADRDLLLYMVMRFGRDLDRSIQRKELDPDSPTILSDFVALAARSYDEKRE